MKLLNIFSYVFFASIVLISCSDDDSGAGLGGSGGGFGDSDGGLVDNKNKYFTGVDLSVEQRLDRPSFSKDTYFALGYGYDITSKYAHPDGIRKSVIDLDKLKNNEATKPSIIQNETTFLGISYPTGLIGTNSEIRNLLLSTSIDLTDVDVNNNYKNAFKGIFDVFKADTSFPDLVYNYNINTYNYSLYHSYILRTSSDLELLNCLSDSFLQDVNSLSADAIIKKYGTHVMTYVVFGLRRDYYYRTTADNNLLDYEIGAMLKVIGSSDGLGITKLDQKNAETDKEDLYIEHVGVSYPKEGPNAWMLDVTNYSGKVVYKYVDPVEDESNLTLIDWKLNSLIPIYELVSDATKKEAIKKAFDAYVGNVVIN